MTCTRPHAKAKKSLDPWAPSTHDPKETSPTDERSDQRLQQDRPSVFRLVDLIEPGWHVGDALQVGIAQPIAVVEAHGRVPLAILDQELDGLVGRAGALDDVLEAIAVVADVIHGDDLRADREAGRIGGAAPQHVGELAFPADDEP